MTMTGVDIAGLSEQLRADGVAYTNPELAADENLQGFVAGHLRPGDGIAVVDVFTPDLADLRDLASDLQQASGLDSVIVQAPNAVSSVSDVYSRAQIESTQHGIPQGLDQASVLDHFYGGLGLDRGPVLVVALVLAVVFVAAGIAAYRAARGDAQVKN